MVEHEIDFYGCIFGLPVSVGGGRNIANVAMIFMGPTYRQWRISLLLAEPGRMVVEDDRKQGGE
jgi:hypothetical protein